MSAVVTERLACPVEGCEATFIRQNKSRHFKDAHGIKTDSDEYRRLVGKLSPASAVEKKSNYSQQLDQRIHEMTKPLRDELRGINKRLSEIDAERAELQDARRKIDQVLRKIDPTSFVAAPKRTRGYVSPNHVGGDGTNEAKRQAVLAFLEAHRDKYEDGILASVLCRDMKAAGVEPIMSPTKVLDFVRALHADGVLRADKKVRGGAMQYKFVSNGGSADGEA
jgi:hypothetical protein